MFEALSVALFLLVLFFCIERHGIVLAYHSTSTQQDDVYTIRPRHVMLCVRLLERLGYVSSLGILGESPSLRRWFLITFDDGYRDNFHFMLWLLRRGYHVVMFVPTSHIGQDNSWDGGNKALMTISQLSYLADHGLVCASHGYVHQRMGSIEVGQLEEDVGKSQVDIQQLKHSRSDCLAYPYGDHNDAVMQVMQRRSIRFSFTTIARQVNPSSSLLDLQIGRLSMRRDWNGVRFVTELLLMRLRGWKQKLRVLYG